MEGATDTSPSRSCGCFAGGLPGEASYGSFQGHGTTKRLSRRRTITTGASAGSSSDELPAFPPGTGAPWYWKPLRLALKNGPRIPAEAGARRPAGPGEPNLRARRHDFDHPTRWVLVQIAKEAAAGKTLGPQDVAWLQFPGLASASGPQSFRRGAPVPLPLHRLGRHGGEPGQLGAGLGPEGALRAPRVADANRRGPDLCRGALAHRHHLVARTPGTRSAIHRADHVPVLCAQSFPAHREAGSARVRFSHARTATHG